MRYVNVDDQFVSEILKANSLEKTGNLNEAEVVVEEQFEEEVHSCPLCESELDEPIAEEAMQECVDFIVATLNEAASLEGEMLEKTNDEDEDEDEPDEDKPDEDEEDN